MPAAAFSGLMMPVGGRCTVGGISTGELLSELDALRRQVAREIHLHPEQIAQRVGILITREPPHHALPTRAPPRRGSGVEALCQPARQRLALRRRQWLGIFRRHLAEVELIQCIVPTLC